MVINSWFGQGAGNNMIKKVMASWSNNFLSQFKLKRLSQSIWFNLIHVLLLLIRLRLLFLLILMNIQMNKMSFIYFLLQNFFFFFFNTAPPAPPFFLGLHDRGCCSTLSTPTSRGNVNVCPVSDYRWLQTLKERGSVSGLQIFLSLVLVCECVLYKVRVSW